MNSREIIKALLAAGWVQARTTGSRWHFHHPERPGIRTAPHPNKERPSGTLRSVERQTGLEFN